MGRLQWAYHLWLVGGIGLLAMPALVFAGHVAPEVPGAMDQEATVDATVRVNVLEVTLFAPSEVKVGDHLEVRAELTNLSSGRRLTSGMAVLLIEPDSTLDVRGTSIGRVGTIQPMRTQTVRWQVLAREPGAATISVEASAALAHEPGIVFEGGDIVAVSVAEGTRGGPPMRGANAR